MEKQRENTYERKIDFLKRDFLKLSNKKNSQLEHEDDGISFLYIFGNFKMKIVLEKEYCYIMFFLLLFLIKFRINFHIFRFRF